MSVEIPNPIGVKLSGSLGSVGPVTLAGIPDTFHIDITHLPKLQIGIDKLQVGIDPLSVSVAVTQLPNVRAHLPANFSLGLSVLGLELVRVRLCGEAQLITEPYVPNPAERCLEVTRQGAAASGG